MLLESEGYEIAEAETGAAGVQNARELTPDLVLLTSGYPTLDGFEVTEAALPDSTRRRR